MYLSVILNCWHLIWVCLVIMSCSFAAPETRAVDCEGGASGGASSPWWNLRDLRSQLRLVGEAIWYVDGIQLVTDFDRTGHLWLSVWEQTNQTDRCSHGRRQTARWHKELRCVFKEVTSSQSYLIIPNRLLFCLTFSPFLHAVKHSLKIKICFHDAVFEAQLWQN